MKGGICLLCARSSEISLVWCRRHLIAAIQFAVSCSLELYFAYCCTLKRTGTFESKSKVMQPRSQSSSAISDVTSPVKLVGKIRARFQASSGHSDSANRPGYEAEGYVLILADF